MWQSTPPTYEQWVNAKNDGMWWVRFMLTPEFTENGFTFPESWYTDVVQISVSYPDGLADGMLGDGRKVLYARGFVLDEIDLDSPKCQGILWQPVIPPRPERIDDVNGHAV